MEPRPYRPLESEQDTGSRKRRFLEGLPILGDKSPENRPPNEITEARAFGQLVDRVSHAMVARSVETQQEVAKVVEDPTERKSELNPLTNQTEELTEEVEKLEEALDQTAQFDKRGVEASAALALDRDRALKQQEARLCVFNREKISADAELRRLYLRRVVDVATRQTEITRQATESIWAAAPELQTQQPEQIFAQPSQVETKDAPTEQEFSDRIERSPGRLDQPADGVTAQQPQTTPQTHQPSDSSMHYAHLQVTTPPPLPPSRSSQRQQPSRSWLVAAVALIVIIGLALLFFTI